ncbi:MAG: very short patch repair endonuclease [Terriglobales bacterium]
MASQEIRRVVDNLSSELRSANMRAVRSRDTRPEKLVRRISHRMGYRFRLHASTLPGRPDLVFPSRHKAIFVHGCFWHRHPCKHGSQRPKTNAAFWTMKIDGNVERDAENFKRLRKAGWRSLVVWECETKQPEKLASRIRRFLA